eukprot:Protomagalhaensia_wolfi_Nauph_80__6001@NODE_816_length_1981_cov_93_843460_g549_i1_p2_GENE_NODE_816_length_1981_cov_93_843460_g549_i1NODE_816_length_1981_cov_93_843460_g549_i1_p2_ORF_typecomplete_len226_score37_13_NODE_816_length_1981_cov_93_843460_g549_i1210887
MATRYCSPIVTPAKATTTDQIVGGQRMSQAPSTAVEYVRCPTPQNGTHYYSASTGTTYPMPPPAHAAAYQPFGSASYSQQSYVAAPTFAERLQSTSEPRRQMSISGSTAGGAPEGQSLTESSGIIYCPPGCSMDLTLGCGVNLPYPSSVPRFQAPVTVSETLSQSYASWEVLRTKAESAQLGLNGLNAAAMDGEWSSRIEEDDSTNQVEETQFPIPPQAVLDDTN